MKSTLGLKKQFAQATRSLGQVSNANPGGCRLAYARRVHFSATNF
jgi:hypothetical protein